MNPDTYTPGLDQFMRATTDYGNLVIALPLIAWMIAYGLFLLMPRFKKVFTGLLVVETIVILVLSVMGKFWPNTVYTGVNVLLLIYWIIAFGIITTIFHRMTRPQMFGFACLFWMVLLGALVNGFGSTAIIKDEVARPRPFNEFHAPWNEGVRHIPDEMVRGASSYPSGHTSGTFVILTPFFWYARRKTLRAGIFAFCVLQGITRVYTAAHFPFDIVMGGVLGFGIGTIIFFALGGAVLRQRAKEDDERLLESLQTT
jgi:membrane-associated phospholipid phosphatase